MICVECDKCQGVVLNAQTQKGNLDTREKGKKTKETICARTDKFVANLALTTPFDP